jgi:conjugal transfer pilus assembly protein TrbC
VRARFNKLIVLGLCAAAAVSVNAAEPRWPTPDEIEAARSRSPMPSFKDIMRQAVPAVPNVKSQRPALDLEDMARRYSANREAFTSATAAQPQLRIFVTLAMPEASLKLLARQASKTQATIVIRGLKDKSMKSTLTAVQRIVGELPVDWQIDPPAFTRFSITRAPTFVLTEQSASAIEPRGCTTNCDKTQTFVSVSGDVSLDYALDVIARTKPAFASDAQRFLSKLRNQVTQ